MIPRLSCVIAAALFLTVVAFSAGAEQVTVQRDTDLRGEASMSAPVVGSVTQGTTGEVTGKRGAWVNIKTPEASGWLFSFNLRFGAVGQSSGDGGAGSVVGRVFGPGQDMKVTSTLGVRGIDKETLTQATFSPDQMRLLDQYAASKDAAAEQAQAEGLEARHVDYLKENQQ